jgi:hypothetical protein
MLRAREHVPTPSHYVVFTLGLVVAIESIKEFGGVSIIDSINLHLLNIFIHQIQANNIMPPIIL